MAGTGLSTPTEADPHPSDSADFLVFALRALCSRISVLVDIFWEVACDVSRTSDGKLSVMSPEFRRQVESCMNLRDELVRVALAWEKVYGVAPSITSTVSEYDAAILVGMTLEEYGQFMKNRTAVSRGSDFIHQGVRYQIKANRPSGKPGSRVTWVPDARENRDWDYIIWVLYDRKYVMQEAWQLSVEEYEDGLSKKKRLSPDDYRSGRILYLHPSVSKARMQPAREIPSSKDYTKYRFNGNQYGKGRLVLAIVREWVANNTPGSLGELNRIFPNDLHSTGLFVPVSVAREKQSTGGKVRHFLKSEELITLADATQLAVTREWGSGNINRFLFHAEKLGVVIEPIG
ncbi:MAG: hypothetical protein HW380_1407 [Magnetococcales bacterium]|nr:hypothetical protein [Magnetococcales bacterium]